MLTFGGRLYAELQIHGMSQKELARKAGTTEVTISRYIKGTRIPKATMLQKISKALGTTPDHLLGIKELEDSIYKRIKAEIKEQCKHWTKSQKISLIVSIMEDEL